MAKIDIGQDKNEILPDKHPLTKALSMFLDDLPKNQDDAISEVRKRVWADWLNSEPLMSAHTEDDGKTSLFFISESVQNKIILIDICDLTLLPCRRALRYVKEWHRRYQSAGLMVIGVHTPFFGFCKDREIVTGLMNSQGVSYPVVMDNDFAIWKAFDNRFWPRRILIDSSGKTQADFVGEGQYPEFERKMQELLRALSPGLPCPPILKPLRDVDREDATPAETTPEIFLGFKKKQRFGNRVAPSKLNEEFLFPEEPMDALLHGVPYFKGAWSLHDENMSVYVPIDPKKAYKGENSITVRFTGTDAFFVARTKAKVWGDPPQSVKFHFLIDHKPLAEEIFGADVSLSDTYRPQIVARDPRLFHIATKLEYGAHTLTVIVDPDGTDTAEIYAIYFDSVV